MIDVEMDDEELTVDEALDDMWHLLNLAKGGSKPARRKVNSLLEQIGEADRRVRQDYEDRFAIELLQNAHDACYDGGVVGSAWFTLTDTALLVGNQGAPFDANRITALTTLGVTSKAQGGTRRHLIGYKGVGFSSVFTVTDRPQILSGAVNFGFDEERARRTIESEIGLRPKKVSARSVPFRLEPSDWDDDWEDVQSILAAGAVTVIRLPLRPTVGREGAKEVLLRSLAPESLLFMPHLDGLHIDLGDVKKNWRRRSGSSIGDGSVVHLENTLDGHKASWLLLDSVTPAPQSVRNLDDDIWKSVAELNVSVAIPWKGKRVDGDRGPQRLHVYFPTDDQTGRSLLIHGDFYVHSSRRSIQDKGPGGEVSNAVAQRAAEMVGAVAATLAPRGGELLSALAVVDTPTSEFSRHLNDLIDRELRESKIVRPAGGSELRKPGDLYLVASGLGEVENEQLSRSLREPKDLVNLEDAGHEDRRQLLKRLGTPDLPVREIARRFSAAKGGGYVEGLTLLYRWWSVIPAFRSRMLVRASRRMRWSKTNQVDGDSHRRSGATRPASQCHRRSFVHHQFRHLAASNWGTSFAMYWG